jgi:hypothetical protein
VPCAWSNARETSSGRRRPACAAAATAAPFGGASASPAPRARTPPRRDRHGRQRPLGQPARPAAHEGS